MSQLNWFLAFCLVVHFPQKRCFGRVVSGPGRRFPRHICHQAGESSVVVTKYVDASFSLLLPWGPLHRALTIWTEWAVTRRSSAQLGSRWHCKRFVWYLLLWASYKICRFLGEMLRPFFTWPHRYDWQFWGYSFTPSLEVSKIYLWTV